MNLAKKLTILVGCAVFAALSTQAAPLAIGDIVTVAETGVSPSQSVTIHSSTLGTLQTAAGLTHITVNGVSTVGFCIDPFQYSSGSNQPYTVNAVKDAPVGIPMGVANAKIIGQLWTSYFTSALSNASVAAGLQIAIWETVGGSNFSLVSGNDYGAAAMLLAVTGSSIASAPNLFALTSRTSQDYIIQVPEGGATVALLGLALIGLAATRKLKFLQS